MNVRDAQYRFAGSQPPPPKRLTHLAEALRAKATEADQLTEILAKATMLKGAMFDRQTIKPLSETDR
jgi:very-short-patch-repair endonuclease